MKLMALSILMLVSLAFVAYAQEEGREAVLPKGWQYTQNKPIVDQWGKNSCSSVYSKSKERFMCKSDVLYKIAMPPGDKTRCGYKPMDRICTCTESGKMASNVAELCVPRMMTVRPSSKTCNWAVIHASFIEEARWEKGQTATNYYFKPIGTYKKSQKFTDAWEPMEFYQACAANYDIGDGSAEEWAIVNKLRNMESGRADQVQDQERLSKEMQQKIRSELFWYKVKTMFKVA